MSKFFVFMCRKCKNFTNAPVGQKRRRCSYCGTIIDITKAAAVLVDGPEAAAAAVKLYNASKGGDEFEKAVEQSRERIKSLLPQERLTAQDVADDTDEPPAGKSKLLFAILQEHASESPISLTELESLCEKRKLSWVWVEKKLTALANNGAIIFPRPWTVKLVSESKSKATIPEASIDISKDILLLLRGRQEPMGIDDIIAHFNERSISSRSVIDSLEKLMSAGEIYEPRQGFVSII